jgi:DNA polymerase (family X)
MQNQRVAYLLHRTARLLDIKGQSEYKVRAYQKAARSIIHMDEDVEMLYRTNKLDTIPGVGQHIAQQIAELLTTGSSAYLNELELEVPPELAELATLPGIGTQTVKTLFQHTTIRTPQELEQAIKDKTLLGVPGLGNQALQRVRRALEKWGAQGECIDLGMAMPLSDGLLLLLAKMPYVQHACIVGDLRRGRELVNDISILAAASNIGAVIDLFKQLPFVKEIMEISAEHCRIKAELGIIVDLKVVSREVYAIEQILSTGSRHHVDSLTKRAVKLGHIKQMDDWVKWMKKSGASSEEEIYRYHQLGFISPEIREDGEEVEADGTTLDLITLDAIKGDLHMHTTWSDGYNSIEEMATTAKTYGYEYIAICDHSRSLSIAGGLSEERLRAQQKEIRELNKKNLGIKILAGVELDILPDRRLDYPDDVLQELDIVIGSIHSGFKQDAATITERIEVAMKNEYVDIIAHPTGRMLRRRPGYNLDMDKLFQTAVKTNTFLEINASPDRLDLRDIHVRQAQEYGCKLVINTDAHDAKHLSDMRYGIINGRRGWLKKENVMNTLDYASLCDSLQIKNSTSLVLT